MVASYCLYRAYCAHTWRSSAGWSWLALLLIASQAAAGDIRYQLAPAAVGFGGHELWQTSEVELIRLPEANLFNPEIQRVSTFALYQPPVPPPDDGIVAPADVNQEGVPEGLQGSAQESPPGGEKPPEQPIGRAPEDTRLNFLRTATVLLQPGQMQFDYGVRYVFRDFSAADLLFPFTRRNRQLYSPFAVRYGLAPRVQLYANLPLGFAIGERNDLATAGGPVGGVFVPGILGDDSHTGIFGLADTSAGVTYLIQKGQCDEPDIIGSLGFVAPTGHHAFEDIADPLRAKPTPISGSGFWAVNTNVTFIKTYDPAVIYGSLGYTHLFARRFGNALNGAFVIPGESFSYGLGLGFAINDRITLSSSFSGTVQTQTSIDLVRTLPGVGTQQTFTGVHVETMQIRHALTCTVSPCQIVEPFVIFGLTRDTPEADLGVTCTRTY